MNEQMVRTTNEQMLTYNIKETISVIHIMGNSKVMYEGGQWWRLWQCREVRGA